MYAWTIGWLIKSQIVKAFDQLILQGIPKNQSYFT